MVCRLLALSKRRQACALQAAPPSHVRQHGFQVKESLGVLQDSTSPQHSSPVGAPPRKREVGFKGLLDVTVRSSLPAPKAPYFPGAGQVEVVGTAHSTPRVRRLVKSVVQGIRACQDPEASSEGLGGTYFFMDDEGRKAAIMKPCDEEPLAPNNPKVSLPPELQSSPQKLVANKRKRQLSECALQAHDAGTRP